MNWKIEVKPRAEKQYSRLDKNTRKRIKKALQDLEREENPLQHHDLRPLTGQLEGDYRLRVGTWRLLMTPEKQNRIIHVYAILPRGDSY
ncbi:MAG: type II toxin-antitoxin system RelE/ParE family toxin [Deltaproteobacteria bacterium]|nr:MAG: type II toxin-antitoxin system RelE/ParE family toxin [Deltaproteobacteria bacterium]